MPREAKIELVEIKAEKRSPGKAPSQTLEAERGRILAALPARCEKVVLDERGEALTTAGLVRWLERWRAGGRDVAFIIGGADGLHADLSTSAERRLSLSPMTLPHGLARVLLAEQLYRAMSIIRGHPYHRK